MIMEDSMEHIEDIRMFSVDVSAVGRLNARQNLLDSITRLGYEYKTTDSFWDYFTRHKSEARSTAWLVLGDLSNIVKQYKEQGRHRWIASVRDNNAYFLALIRTRLDERVASWVDDLVRHSDMRVTVCRVEEKELKGCIIEALTALQPHSLTDVRYSTSTNQLWVQFGDGVSGFVDWEQLGLKSKVADLLLETSTVGDIGESVEIVQRDGKLLEIDADVIRAIIDKGLAALIATDAKKSDQKVGEGVRWARETAKLSQKELSKITGIDQAIISKLERGSHQPRFDTLERISKGLGISLTELLMPRHKADS